ncbi:MAG: AraC family transcriptional regulator [Candidatus Firestonebacteria bacterium]
MSFDKIISMMITSRTNNEYIKRINLAIDYINSNVHKNLSLKEIASSACFSKYHFHRIFKAIVGETLKAFVERLRIEKSVVYVTRQADRDITGIAMKLGYSSPSTFSRAFKKRFGISATEARGLGFKNFSKICKGKSNNGKAKQLKIAYNSSRAKIYGKGGNMRNVTVEIKELADLRVAYVRETGPYDESAGRAFPKLCKWAWPRKFLNKKHSLIGVSYDDPGVADAKKCRYDACVTVPENVEADAVVNIRKIPGGLHAVFHCKLGKKDFKKAYGYAYGKWLPENNFLPADRPAYEVYLKDGRKDGIFEYDLCVPIEKI